MYGIDTFGEALVEFGPPNHHIEEILGFRYEHKIGLVGFAETIFHAVFRDCHKEWLLSGKRELDCSVPVGKLALDSRSSVHEPS